MNETSPAPRTPKGPVALTFGRGPNLKLILNHSATTRTRTYQQTQIVRDRSETVDFSTQLETHDRDPATGIHFARIKTLKVEGNSRLHAMAFPERGETIEFLLRADGRVIRAASFPTSSVFYVPSLPLPAVRVDVGESWTMDHAWGAGGGRLPLRIEVVGILKRLLRCANGHACADLEISGHMLVNWKKDKKGPRFDSRLRGRALFDIERGEVSWNEVRSREEISFGPEVSLVEACLISREGPGPLSCAPEFDAPLNVPET